MNYRIGPSHDKIGFVGKDEGKGPADEAMTVASPSSIDDGGGERAKMTEDGR